MKLHMQPQKSRSRTIMIPKSRSLSLKRGVGNNEVGDDSKQSILEKRHNDYWNVSDEVKELCPKKRCKCYGDIDKYLGSKGSNNFLQNIKSNYPTRLPHIGFAKEWWQRRRRRRRRRRRQKRRRRRRRRRTPPSLTPTLTPADNTHKCDLWQQTQHVMDLLCECNWQWQHQQTFRPRPKLIQPGTTTSLQHFWLSKE